VPKVDPLAEPNGRPAAACRSDLDRTIVGRPEPVGAMLERERRLLADLPAEPHPTAEARMRRASTPRRW